MELKELIKAKRLEFGYTQKELANLIGVNVATVSRWETGDIASMKLDAIKKVASILKIPTDVIMGWDTPEELKDDEYYLQQEAREYAEYARTNPEVRVLFDASRDVSENNMKKAVEFVQFLKTKENGE